MKITSIIGGRHTGKTRELIRIASESRYKSLIVPPNYGLRERLRKEHPELTFKVCHEVSSYDLTRIGLVCIDESSFFSDDNLRSLVSLAKRCGVEQLILATSPYRHTYEKDNLPYWLQIHENATEKRHLGSNAVAARELYGSLTVDAFTAEVLGQYEIVEKES